MKINIAVLSILIFLIFSSCSSEEEPTFCVSFDTRQCMGDLWASSVDRGASQSEQLAQFEDFLTQEGIEFKEVKMDFTFHDIVCEACFVCPENPRISVRANEMGIRQIFDLSLLNPSELTDCSDF